MSKKEDMDLLQSQFKARTKVLQKQWKEREEALLDTIAYQDKKIKDLKKNPTFNYGKAVLSMETLLDLLLGTSFGVAAILTTQYEDDYSLKDTFNEIDKQLEKIKETGKAPWENNDEDALKEE